MTATNVHPPSGQNQSGSLAGSIPQELQPALLAKLTALADDLIVLSHRNAEWTGHAPILEEDIALANIAQDQLGHASLYLTLLGELDGTDPDRHAYFRGAREYRNAQMMELPKGDWAFTMLRQYLVDAYEVLWFSGLKESRVTALADIAAKALREKKFHLQHTALWVERLALGTDESHRRMQDALNTLWLYVPQLFQPVEGEEALVAAGLTPDLGEIHGRWDSLVTPFLTDKCGLTLPTEPAPDLSREIHSEDLIYLLAEMQVVAREFRDVREW
ncbi:1,2-phenylacetyl-CoA epoxidase subunit PaaC [Deinococcus lacus]|uniref:1,2-phenylacetyl-CoA epoxidase subunit PaaC n=1 Tax=Deinococcus lacus TaxID=392561 RepID=A0ABW1YCV1_9DEIO